MNGLAICAGIGGLELGLHLALPGAYRTVCFIEREAYAAATLVARMADAALDQAPIWDDLTTFDSRPWRGIVDIVTAGFPCQPFSLAGQRKGDQDERWLWPYILKIISDLRPQFVFLENVPGILTASGGIESVLSGLALAGYDAEWECFSAAECGATQIRERFFLLGYSNGVAKLQSPHSGVASGRRHQGRHISRAGRHLYPPGPRQFRELRALPDDLKPAVCRSAHGAANRVERLHALGNGVVPLVAAYAFRTLAARAGIEL